jgi:hypothetical protein
MGILKKLGKSGMFGLAGLAATNKDVTNKIARNGGLGLSGMLMAKKKRDAQPGRPMMAEEARARAQMMRRPMVDGVMMDEGAPAGSAAGNPTFRGENTKEFKKGGKVKKKMAAGGSTASKRADGCATQGRTKGRFV